MYDSLKKHLEHTDINTSKSATQRVVQNDMGSGFALKDFRPETQKAIQMKKMMDSYVPKNIIQRKENNTGLPDNLKSGVENLSGYSMDDVKVHYNSDKPAQLNAHAYAQGTDIHLASGQEKHLPHEAWHVVQQKQGRVQPTLQMKEKVNINDDEDLESEATRMGDEAVKSSTLNSIQKKEAVINTSKSTTVQRWIMMSSAATELAPEDDLAEHLITTSSKFDKDTKKPIDNEFNHLISFEDTKVKVAEALSFLDLKKPKSQSDDFQDNDSNSITIEDIEDELKSWMGVVSEDNVESVQDEMDGDVLKPQSDKEQYNVRAKAKTKAEMRYYNSYEELAWALVQSLGLQVPMNLLDTYDKEIYVAQYTIQSSSINNDLEKVIQNIFKYIAEIEVSEMKGRPDYAPFHKINTWEDFKEKYNNAFMPESFMGKITFLHDIKSYFAISKHSILDNKPSEIIVTGNEESGLSKKINDTKGAFPGEMSINKTDMRYNLGTVDEADPFTLFMRSKGRSVWAAPSFTTVSMLEIAKQCGCNEQELTAIAYGIFSFWCIQYPKTATPIHTFHEVMAAAQSYGVNYNPDLPVVSNANNAIGYP